MVYNIKPYIDFLSSNIHSCWPRRNYRMRWEYKRLVFPHRRHATFRPRSPVVWAQLPIDLTNIAFRSFYFHQHKMKSFSEPAKKEGNINTWPTTPCQAIIPHTWFVCKSCPSPKSSTPALFDTHVRPLKNVKRVGSVLLLSKWLDADINTFIPVVFTALIKDSGIPEKENNTKYFGL